MPELMTTPILYSFRRCPYAMRARLALFSSKLRFEWREILLRDKPEAFLSLSHDGTVPLLAWGNATIQESFEIMKFALEAHDPDGWLGRYDEKIVAEFDGQFKRNLDEYKYASRYNIDPINPRARAQEILQSYESALAHGALHGANWGLSDMAVLPFVRQFAHVDQDWFYAQDWPNMINWLDKFKNSEIFLKIMKKIPPWHEGAAAIYEGEINIENCDDRLDS